MTMKASTIMEPVASDHVLMAHATRRPYKSVPTLPHDTIYDPSRGYWVTLDKPLVVTEEFVEGGANTKKCDQETGEDQKGE